MGLGMMAQPASSAHIRLSLLDRLTDRDPGSSGDPAPGRQQDLRELKASLWRDLNALLNCKRRQEEVPAIFTECGNSLLTWGIPDFTAWGLKNPTDQSRLRRAIETAIRKFEPRLTSVAVSFDVLQGDARQDLDPRLRFRVDAVLKVEPQPEPIRFETILQADTGHIFVVGDTG
jgi:type VI secretion system protein ImpF